MENKIIYPFLSKEKENTVSIIDSVEGITLIDEKGNKYIDAISGLWNMPLGYTHKAAKEAIIKQIDNVPFVNLEMNSTITQHKLAQKLLSLTHDDMVNVIYGTTGSDIVDMSIKLARQYQFFKNRPKRKYIVSFDLSYHGTTYGSLSLSGAEQAGLFSIDPLMGGVCIIKTYHSNMNLDEYVNYIMNFFNKNIEMIAGIIIEPVLGIGGILKIPEEVIDTLNSICKKNDIVIIADEITTAFYRSGKYFGYQIYKNFKPNILLLSKALTNGLLPLSVAIIDENIKKSYGQYGVLPHVTTQGGNPICCAAALEVLNSFDYLNYENDIKPLQIMILKHLKILEKKKSVKEIRNVGMMYAIEICDETNKPLSYDNIWSLFEKIKLNGLIVYPYVTYKTSGLILMPSYNMREKEVSSIINILQRSI